MNVNTSKESIQQLVRMGWKYNKNLEEQASQLHMLVGWSQIVEVIFSLLIISFFLFELLSLNSKYQNKILTYLSDVLPFPS